MGATASIFLLTPTNLFAQEIEEVVTTATRKAESVQDVALSVQALSADALADAQVTEVQDLAELVPGFSYQNVLGSGSLYTIRGASSAAVGAGTATSVQTAINGHTLAGSAFGEIGFFDVEQVNILAGPQGTLYGRNVVGGLINLVTARPEAEAGGYLNVEMGNYGSERVTTAINMPFGDNVRTRLAYGSFVKDGWVKNIGTGNDIDGRDSYAVRLSVDVDIDDTSGIRFNTAEYSSDDNRMNIGGQYCETNIFYGCSPFAKGQLGQTAHEAGTIIGFIDSITFLRPTFASDSYANSQKFATLDMVNKNHDPDRQMVVQNSQIEYIKELNDLTFKAKYSYSVRDYQHTDDQDHSNASETFSTAVGPVPAFELQFQCFNVAMVDRAESVECSQDYDINRQSEINLISDFDGPHNFTAGLYMRENDNANNYFVQTAGYQMLRSFDLHPYSDSLFGGAMDGKGGIAYWSVFGGVFGAVAPSLLGGLIDLPTALAQITGGTLATCAGLGGLCDRTLPNELGGLVTSQNSKVKSNALFGEYYYDINEATKLTLGMRYNDDTYESTIFSTLGDVTNPNYTYNPVYSRNNSGQTREQTENSAFTYKMAVQHFINDNSMVYASYTTGLKAGGTSPNELGVNLPYGEEESINTEIGTRNILMDGRLLVNATYFEFDVTNGQYGQLERAGVVNRTFDYINKGFEGQMKFFITDNTQLDFNFLASDSAMGNGFARDPNNPNGATQLLGSGFGNDTLAGFLMMTGMDAATAAGTAAAIGANFGTFAPGVQWGLTDAGIIYNFQGDVQTLPGLSSDMMQSLEGNNVPLVADLDYNLSLSQRFPASGGATDVKLTYVHKGERDGDIFKLPEAKYMDMLVTYTPSSEDWYVGGFIKNIADKRYQHGVTANGNLAGGGVHITFANPRTYGIKFGMNF
jgi:outer membrane receptor protein involved in Fe transport